MIGICLLAFQAAASAETMYVNDTIRITVRSGPGIDFKVMGEAESGQAMDVREAREGWSRVVLPDGREGWVLARFLTANQPKEVQLKALRKSYDALTAEKDALVRENERMKEENRQLGLLSDENRRSLETMSNAYETLKTESKDFLKMKAAYETASRNFAEQKQTTEALKGQMETLEWQKNAVFFIGGGVMVLLGFFIGMMSRTDSRRKSSLL